MSDEHMDDEDEYLSNVDHEENLVVTEHGSARTGSMVSVELLEHPILPTQKVVVEAIDQDSLSCMEESTSNDGSLGSTSKMSTETDSSGSLVEKVLVESVEQESCVSLEDMTSHDCLIAPTSNSALDLDGSVSCSANVAVEAAEETSRHMEEVCSNDVASTSVQVVEEEEDTDVDVEAISESSTVNQYNSGEQLRTITCEHCGSESMNGSLQQFKKIQEIGRLKRGQKQQYIWRHRCAVKSCNQFFGRLFRFNPKQPTSFIEVNEDGEPIAEGEGSAAVNSDISQDSSFMETSSSQLTDSSMTKSPSKMTRSKSRSASVSNEIGKQTPVDPLDITECSTAQPLRGRKRQRITSRKNTVRHVKVSESDVAVVDHSGDTTESEPGSQSAPSSDSVIVDLDADPFPTLSESSTQAARSAKKATVLPVPGKSVITSKGKVRMTKEAAMKARQAGIDAAKKRKLQTHSPSPIRVNKSANHQTSNGVPPSNKKMKGYAYVVEPIAAPALELSPMVQAAAFLQQQQFSDPVSTSSDRRGVGDRKWASSAVTSEGCTQTDENDLEAATLLGLIEEKTEDMGGDSDEKLSSSLARRLVLSQKIINEQSVQLKQMRGEKEGMLTTYATVMKMTKTLRETYAKELRRIKEDVEFLSGELKFYHAELTTDAKRSLDEIRKEKAFIKTKADELRTENIRLDALYKLSKKELEAQKNRCQMFSREIATRDRNVIAANKERDVAEKNLADRLYIQNNERCTHCRSTLKTREMLTGQVASLSLSLKTTQKDRDAYLEKMGQLELSSRKMHKDLQRVSYEARGYKAEFERVCAELELVKKNSGQFAIGSGSSSKDGTPRQGISTPSQTGGGKTPATSEKDSSTPKDAPSSISPPTAGSDPASVSPDSLSLLPPPPEPPCPFSNWIPKNKKAEKPPPGFDEISFFKSTGVSSSSRPGNSGPARHREPSPAPSFVPSPREFSSPPVTEKVLSKAERKAARKAARLELYGQTPEELRREQEAKERERVAREKMKAAANARALQKSAAEEEANRKKDVRWKAKSIMEKVKERSNETQSTSSSSPSVGKGNSSPLLIPGKINARIPKKTSQPPKTPTPVPVRVEKETESPPTSSASPALVPVPVRSKSKDVVSSPPPAETAIPVISAPSTSATVPVSPKPTSSSSTPAPSTAAKASFDKEAQRKEQAEWQRKVKQTLDERERRKRIQSAVASPTNVASRVAFNGPVVVAPFNGPCSSLPSRQPQPHPLMGVPSAAPAHQRPWNGPAQQDLPFEPIDDAWGVRGPSNWRNAAPSDPVWSRDGRVPAPSPIPMYQPTMPSRPAPRMSTSWSNSDNWSTMAGDPGPGWPPHLPPSQPQQQRRNFWAP